MNAFQPTTDRRAIVTLTANPAIDQTITVESLTLGAVNRSRTVRLDAGGKGVIVAMRLADYGIPVHATGFLGRDNAALFEQVFARKGIIDDFVRVDGETRVNTKIVDLAHGDTTDLNAVGIQPDTQAMAQLRQTLQGLSASCGWLAIGGQLQACLPSTLYADLIHMACEQGMQVLLDTSGDALRHGIDAGATVIKPNIHELSELLGRELHELSAIKAGAQSLLNAATRLVAVSMGADGALFVSADEAWLARPPQVQVLSTVGAGDSMVAGLLAALTAQLSLADCACLATAFSLCAVTQWSRDLPPHSVVNDWMKQVQVTAA